MTEVISKRSGDPFFARAAEVVSGSSAGGFSFSTKCDAIYIGSSNASGLICRFASQTSDVTLPASISPGIYPFSLTSISSGGGASAMNIVGLFTGGTTTETNNV